MLKLCSFLLGVGLTTYPFPLSNYEYLDMEYKLQARLEVICTPDSYQGVNPRQFIREYHEYAIPCTKQTNSTLANDVLIGVEGGQFEQYSDDDIFLAVFNANLADEVTSLEIDDPSEMMMYIILYEVEEIDDEKSNLLDDDSLFYWVK